MKQNYTIHDQAMEMLKEGSFELFRHKELLCCVVRMGWSGQLNGYVAVPKSHPLYEKKYNDHVVVADKASIEFNGNYIGLLCHSLSEERETDLLSLDLAIKVHGGLTYSRDALSGIDESVFPDLWWFGFDTCHSGDLRPYQSDIDRKYSSIHDGEYRSMEYVKNETTQLAEQLAAYNN